MNLERATKQLEALGNPTRLQVCRMLVRAGEPGLSVVQLRQQLGIAPSTLSRHLSRLGLTGLVTQKHEATALICLANSRAIDSLLGYLIDEFCADAAPTKALAGEGHPASLFSK
jgi:DNA-binding transcriptional ArsR family regulator